MSILSLDLLRTFVTFVESAGITEASRKLHLSQPAVSVQLRKLEESLDHPLFTFQGKRKVLTHYGRAMYEILKGKLSEIDSSVEAINLRYADPTQVRLRVGARKEVIARIASQITFPGRLYFVNMSNQEILSKLIKNEIDIGITHQRPDQSNIFSKVLFSEGTRFCIHRDLLGKNKLSLSLVSDPEFLLNTPCVAYKIENPPFLRTWAEHCKFDLEKLFIKCVCDDWIAIMKMVEGKVGYSIIPEGVPLLSPEILAIPLPEKIIPRMSFYLMYSTALKGIKGIRDLIRVGN